MYGLGCCSNSIPKKHVELIQLLVECLFSLCIISQALNLLIIADCLKCSVFDLFFNCTNKAYLDNLYFGGGGLINCETAITKKKEV